MHSVPQSAQQSHIASSAVALLISIMYGHGSITPGPPHREHIVSSLLMRSLIYNMLPLRKRDQTLPLFQGSVYVY